MNISIKRVYDELDDESYRVLADRLWPRGIKKEVLHPDIWPKEICPSNQLRKDLHSNKVDQEEFTKLYKKEIKENDKWDEFKDSLKGKDKISLLSAAKDPIHCRIIKEELEKE
jgi:uncharacterized protein YeaO (DUF488 family)